jgi:hypothetical protein
MLNVEIDKHGTQKQLPQIAEILGFTDSFIGIQYKDFKSIFSLKVFHFG